MIAHTDYLTVFQLKHDGFNRRVVNVRGETIALLHKSELDWGPQASREARRGLAHVLLYHARVGYLCLGSDVAADAFAVAVAGVMPASECAITGDQVRAWFSSYLIQGRFFNGRDHNYGSRRRD